MKLLDIKLPFGLSSKDGIIVHVSEVNSGKKCDCICPSCLAPLVAAKGNIKQHHFKHAVDRNCLHGLESAIHMAAKQILSDRKEITLPEHVLSIQATDSEGVEYVEEEIIVPKGKIIHFDTIESEVELNGIRADILGKVSNTPLIIEIYYRHKVDEEKRQKIFKGNISAIEIDLSELNTDDPIDWDTLWAHMNDTNHSNWIYNAKAQSEPSIKLKEKLSKKISHQEKNYEQIKLRKQKEEKKERRQLIEALETLKKLHAEENIIHLKETAELHQAWKKTSRSLQLSWSELPNFLRLNVNNGDWIFGCDRSVWQSAIYSAFIRKGKGSFSIQRVDVWLRTKAGCDVNQSVDKVDKLGRKHFDLIPDELRGNIPSTWKTLEDFFEQLCTHKIISFCNYDRKHHGSMWYTVNEQIIDNQVMYNRY